MKRYLSMILGFIMVISMFLSPARADSGSKVTVMPQAQGIPPETVADIVASNPGCDITIHEWGYAQPEQQISPHSIIIGTIGFDVTQKTTTAQDVVVFDAFIISVARGQKVELGKIVTYKLECGITGKATQASLSLTASLSKVYNATSSWSGPPEVGVFNSREYRIRFYRDEGTYKGYETFSGVRIGSEVSGTWKNPTKYAQYSIDRTIG